jgi:hypothetical protein
MDILRDDLLWLAGLLEGEGSFVKGPPSRPNAIGIAVEMIDEDVIERLANLFRVALVRLPSRNDKCKPTFRVLLRGDRAAALMNCLRPLMSRRRQQQIDAALASYKPNPRHWSKRSYDLPTPEAMRELHTKMSIRAIARKVGCSPAEVHRRLHLAL